MPEVGTPAGLAFIHEYLFAEIYPFAGKLRELNIAKGHFRFASVMFLEPSLEHINQMALISRIDDREDLPQRH